MAEPHYKITVLKRPDAKASQILFVATVFGVENAVETSLGLAESFPRKKGYGILVMQVDEKGENNVINLTDLLKDFKYE